MKYIIAALVLIPFVSSASYVNSCKLKVSIFDYQLVKELGVQNHPFGIPYEMTDITIEGDITSAEKYGRADSGCASYLGKKLNETFFFRSEQAPTLAKGGSVYIHVFTKDYMTSNDRYGRKTGFSFIGTAD